MKKSEIMIAGRYLAAPAAGAGGAAMVCIRVDLLARYRSQDTSDDDAIAAFDPAFDRPQVADLGADRDLALLHHVVLVDDQEVAPALVAAERGIRHQQ
jgi:hypothetical protein